MPDKEEGGVERQRCVFCQREIATEADWDLNAELNDLEVDAPGSKYAYLNALCWEPENESCIAVLADSDRPQTLGVALLALAAAQSQANHYREALEGLKRRLGEEIADWREEAESGELITPTTKLLRLFAERVEGVLVELEDDSGGEGSR